MKDLIYVQFAVDEKIYKITTKRSNFPIKKESENEKIIYLDSSDFLSLVNKIDVDEILKWKNKKYKTKYNWKIILASNYEVIIESGNEYTFENFDELHNLIKLY